MTKKTAYRDHPVTVARIVHGLHLFLHCQRLARQLRKRLGRHILLPSGARIFYYTRLALLRQGYPAIDPDEKEISQELVERFLYTANRVARHLALDFPFAIRLLSTPKDELLRLRAAGLLPHKPQFQIVLAYLKAAPHTLYSIGASSVELSSQCQRISLLRLLVSLSPQRLFVAPIAHSNDSDKTALFLLRARLAQDTKVRQWVISHQEVYLYDEPLIHWLRRLFED